eukprot:3937020-Rhodomonas_salina.3
MVDSSGYQYRDKSCVAITSEMAPLPLHPLNFVLPDTCSLRGCAARPLNFKRSDSIWGAGRVANSTGEHRFQAPESRFMHSCQPDTTQPEICRHAPIISHRPAHVRPSPLASP